MLTVHVQKSRFLISFQLIVIDWKSVVVCSWIISNPWIRFLLMRAKKSKYIYSIYTLAVKKSVFKVSWILDSLSFDPFICYRIVSCFIGTCFSQVLFEWCWLELILNKIPAFCSSFLELEDEHIRMPLQCIRILIHSIRMLFPASGYLRYSSPIVHDFLRDIDSISLWFIV